MTVELALETVTPLFLGGADQGPELRPAAFRGALRYWYRALTGAVVGDDVDSLRQAEKVVFGLTDGASAVNVRLRGVLSAMSGYDLDRVNGEQVRNGHNYLFYSTRLGENRRVPYAPRPASSASPLILTIASRWGAFDGARQVQRAAGAAWLLTHLGGLGMRSRRCAGSLQVARGSCAELPGFVPAVSNAAELKEHLAGGLRQLLAMAGTLRSPSLQYDVLHPAVCRIWVLEGAVAWSSWKAAVEEIGTVMRDFRAGQGAKKNVANSIFGVPIRHGHVPGLKRRASPLWLRVTRLANNRYVGIATLFKADFKSGSHEVGGGYALIEQFISAFSARHEVQYR